MPVLAQAVVMMFGCFVLTTVYFLVTGILGK